MKHPLKYTTSADASLRDTTVLQAGSDADTDTDTDADTDTDHGHAIGSAYSCNAACQDRCSHRRGADTRYRNWRYRRRSNAEEALVIRVS